ncbi:Uncharacterized protein FKW44_005536 [Caligus rogercresseyi]|uniref:PiggyBac transposable element-derived protein domain-containing protein n=1 Tax=Caligus rogercresseyi TaxID=217165 RepID=A0A7T8QS45_CALRO|nr:Uncharacterized protein FKW44_005536 [Caligus rogercresseyi]
MGGVDKHDQLVQLYRTFIRSRKWPLRMIFHLINMGVSNACLECAVDASLCKPIRKANQKHGPTHIYLNDSGSPLNFSPEERTRPSSTSVLHHHFR